ncbi:indolepyruvate ferredoxin oxidoreductase subunit alpha [Caldicoprobacter faecalis]
MYDACAGCGDCARYCPPKAIKMMEGKPRIDLNTCIRCYCCQELCPHKAVVIRRNWFFRLFK